MVCGSMFSGKTEELIRRIKKVELAGKKYKVFRPKTDNMLMLNLNRSEGVTTKLTLEVV